MWQGWAQSRRRCGTGGPSPGADVAGVGPVAAQMLVLTSYSRLYSRRMPCWETTPLGTGYHVGRDTKRHGIPYPSHAGTRTMSSSSTRALRWICSQPSPVAAPIHFSPPSAPPLCPCPSSTLPRRGRAQPFPAPGSLTHSPAQLKQLSPALRSLHASRLRSDSCLPLGRRRYAHPLRAAVAGCASGCRGVTAEYSAP